MNKIKAKKLAKFGFATMIGLFMASAASSFECKEREPAWLNHQVSLVEH